MSFSAESPRIYRDDRYGGEVAGWWDAAARWELQDGGGMLQKGGNCSMVGDLA